MVIVGNLSYLFPPDIVYLQIEDINTRYLIFA